MITPDATSEPEITGGYIWKKDKFDPADQIFTAAGKDLIGVDPQDMPSAQLNWLIDHINAIDEAIPHGGYPSLIDVESFADHHIFNVFANNADGLNFSTFYHKDRGGLVRMGPVWDFDRSMACDIDAFKARYPAWNTYNIMGGFTGSLENSGERLLLGYDTPGGITLADISYADDWYPLTDGTGFSLVLRDAQSDPAGWNSREAWRHSASIDGTPGEADPDPRATLVHYWNFNQSASLLDPTRTKGDGAMAVGLSGSAAILASTGQDFFAENARDGDPAGSHLRVNYPLGATLTLALPTCGFDGIVVAYERRRSGQGAGLQQVEVTTAGMNYSPFATIPVLDAPPVLRMLDFRGFPGAADNPMFGLRITFEQGAGGNAGNNRIDNLTVDGTPIDFAKLRQTTPLFATWDDHDYGLNDGGAGFRGAAASQREFCDFFQVPAESPLRSSPGVYDCVNFGPAGKRVQLILLDTRSFRSPLKKDPCNPKVNAPNTDAGATILGGKQWAWLERRLREPAEIRAVVSSISFISTEHGSEKWANFPQERARFLELLHRTQARGVVVISGDRHLAELSMVKPADGAPYPLYDLTTSGLNQPVAKESEYRSENPPKGPPNRYRIHERPYTGSNFGLMRIRWNGPQPSASLEIRGLGGEVVISHDVASESISGHNP